MRHKANPVIAKRITNRNRTTQIKKLAAQGLPPEQIARETRQSIEYINLTLEDFDPNRVARNNERRKAKAKQTTEERGSQIGRPPKVDNKEKPEEIESTLIEGTLTVEDVLAKYKQIKENYNSGKYKSVGQAAESVGLEYKLVHRICKGTWPDA